MALLPVCGHGLYPCCLPVFLWEYAGGSPLTRQLSDKALLPDSRACICFIAGAG
ncbi:hypothetical protein [uncultured Cloacibacillus sp.]|uniref:hypothetical protein n=1 Tax=uncultured Cloacibacillus sp. TaxID=889794 RepID=UPI00258AE16A|nr:hypothetical protein [uncultured Cloacibacillus sp.]